MNRYLGWALKLFGLYFLSVVAYFLFALASMRYETLAIYDRKLNPATFVFWQNGKLYANPPLFSGLMADAKGQFTNREPMGLGDVDIWVLLLEGFEDIENVEFASQLGIDINSVRTLQPGNSTSIRTASINLRAHPIPVYVERKHILITDGKYLREHFKKVCLDEMVYGLMIGHRNPELWERCKIS